MKYDINKPWLTLDPWQKKYIDTKGNCFLLCGRQSGKTAAASIKFGKRAATKPNRVILMLAFTEKQAYNLFFKTLIYLKTVYPKMIKKGHDKPTKHIINLKNGSTIMCYAAGLTGEGIRTYTVTDLVIDEAAPMAREVFVATTPMLSVTNGNLDILSTPRGKEGYFFECSDQCQKVKPNFTRFYVSAEDCPRHSKEFLENELTSMTELEYAQEYLAKFLDELRRVYPEELISKCCTLKRRDSILKNRDYYLGVDIARMGKDESTFEIIDRIDSKNLIQVENLITTKTLTTATTNKIIMLNKVYNFRQIFIDDGGMGVGVLDQLLTTEETKRKTIAINNQSRPLSQDQKGTKKIIKEDVYNNLKMLMERGEIKLLDDPELVLSLASMQFQITNGKVKYFGNYTHIADGLIRAAWSSQDKSLKPYIF